MAATATAYRADLSKESIQTALTAIGPVNGLSMVKTGASVIIVYW